MLLFLFHGKRFHKKDEGKMNLDKRFSSNYDFGNYNKLINVGRTLTTEAKKDCDNDPLTKSGDEITIIPW